MRANRRHLLVAMIAVCLLTVSVANASDDASLTLRGHERWVLTVAFNPDSETILSGGDDQTLKQWSLKKSEQPKTLRRFISAVTSVSFSPDGKRFAVGTWDSQLEVCDAHSGKRLVTLTGHSDSITTVQFDPTGAYVASGSADDTLIVWDASNGEQLMTLHQGNEYDVTTAAFSPDGKRLITGDGENELKVWDAQTGEELNTLRGHLETVTSVAYSTNGKFIVSGSWDDTLIIWNASNGKKIKTLQGHTDDITSLDISSDNRLILSGSDDNTVRVWDSHSGKLLMTRKHQDNVTSVAFSADGKRIVSGSKNELNVWPTPKQRAWELGWPSLQGPNGNFTPVRTGKKLVDDLADARLVWESKETDFGKAKHTTSTFKKAGNIMAILGPDAAARPGGWAAPIIAEGKLFASTFRPSGKTYDVQTLRGGTEKGRLEAEDVVIALDAKTGKTIWKVAEPGGFVWGVGKRHGYQVAPVYYNGKVFSMGTTGRVFAYSAADGTKFWETKPEPKMVEERDTHLAKSHILQASSRYGWQQSLVFADNTLVVPRKSNLIGLNPKNGQRKWELEKVISSWATPSPWKHGEKDYLLSATVDIPTQAKLYLIDPSVGKIVWTMAGLHGTHFTLSPSENIVLVNVGSTINRVKPNSTSIRDDNGKVYYGRPGAYRITPSGAERLWSFPDQPQFLFPTWFDSAARTRFVIRDDLVYYSSGGPNRESDFRMIVADANTGKILANEPRENDYWFQLIEDKILHAIDWSHGKRARFDLYSADPSHFKKLGEPWAPDQPLTTAYLVPMEPPVINGKIFLRTETGTVVCYDLTTNGNLE